MGELSVDQSLGSVVSQTQIDKVIGNEHSFGWNIAPLKHAISCKNYETN